MRDLRDYSLKAHNTFGIEASCRRFLEYGSVEEARQVAAVLREGDEPFLIIGGGSNLLLTRDFDGIVVRSSIGFINFEGRCVSCGSGTCWDDVVAACVAHDLYGAENLSLIPGDVGACAVQNIGAYGVEARDLIEKVWAVEIATGQLKEFRKADCGYGYRDSKFKHEWKNDYLIVQVDFLLDEVFRPRLDYGNIRAEMARQGVAEPTAQQLRDVIIGIRQEKLPDPKVIGNAGSFFMNPIVSREKYEELAARYENMPHYYINEHAEKIPAGWMIDQCGWKGRSLGRAGVHDKQALVLVNRGGATGAEVVRLSEAIQQDVLQRFGVEIRPEVNIV